MLSNSRPLLVSFLALVLSLTACAGNVSPSATEAVKAYEGFIENLRACGQDEAYQQRSDKKSCDIAQIWASLDAQSKRLFVQAYAALVRIDSIIEVYFDPIEHKHMRERTGTNVLQGEPIESPEALFAYLFKPKALVFNDNTNSGVQFASDNVQSPNDIVIQTHSAQQRFEMIKESDQVWRNAGLRPYLQVALKPIFDSEIAMREYAKGNLLNEIQRRKELIDYFLLEEALRAKK